MIAGWPWAPTTLSHLMTNSGASSSFAATSTDIGSIKRRWGQFDQEKAAEILLRTVLGAGPSASQGYEG